MVSVCILLLLFPTTAQAQDGVVPYSVEAVIPENQVNDEASYFDIEMEPGQSQNLEVVIYNSSDETITVNVENNFATTNSNGLIVYDQSDDEPHESMLYPFNEISSLDNQEVEVPPNEQKTVTINVQAPENSFDGVILGGLFFQMEMDDSEEEQNVQIQNRYSYALAVQIRETGNDNTVEPNLEFMEASPGIINHRTGLQTQFVNTTPIIIDGLEITGSVYEEGSEEAIYTRMEEEFTVAPNSKFNFPIMYDNQRLESGDYIFRATANDGSREWEFEEEFEVTEEDADQANEEAVELEEEDNSWLIYLVIGLAVVILLLLIIIIMLVNRRKK